MSGTPAMSEGREPKTLWNRSFIMILLISIFNNSATMMITPLISKYSLSLGISLTAAGTITSLMSIVALFMRPITGFVSDRFNRKKISICTCFFSALVLFCYTLAGSMPKLILVRILHGVVFSFSSVALTAFNTAFIPQDRLGEGLGWLSLAQIISFSVGPNLGLFIADKYGYMTCFYIAAGIYSVSTFLVHSIRYKHKTVEASGSESFNINNLISLRVLPYAALMGLFSCGNGLENTFIALLGDDRGIANIGIFFTAYSITLLAVRPFSGKLLDSKGLKIILYPSIAIYAAGVFILSGAQTLLPVIIAGVLKAIGQGAGSPSIQATCIRTLGKEKAGVVSSTCFIGSDIGNSLAPILGGRSRKASDLAECLLCMRLLYWQSVIRSFL